VTRKLSAKSDAAVALLIAGCVAPVAPSTGAAPIAPASRDYGPTVAQAVGAYLRTFKLDEKALAAGLAIPWAGVDPKRDCINGSARTAAPRAQWRRDPILWLDRGRRASSQGAVLPQWYAAAEGIPSVSLMSGPDVDPANGLPTMQSANSLETRSWQSSLENYLDCRRAGGSATRGTPPDRGRRGEAPNAERGESAGAMRRAARPSSPVALELGSEGEASASQRRQARDLPLRPC
jgi:hypothetical protein